MIRSCTIIPETVVVFGSHFASNVNPIQMTSFQTHTRRRFCNKKKKKRKKCTKRVKFILFLSYLSNRFYVTIFRLCITVIVVMMCCVPRACLYCTTAIIRVTHQIQLCRSPVHCIVCPCLPIILIITDRIVKNKKKNIHES